MFSLHVICQTLSQTKDEQKNQKCKMEEVEKEINTFFCICETRQQQYRSLSIRLRKIKQFNQAQVNNVEQKTT